MAQNHIDQPGLRARMSRERARISSQHRQLDTLYEMILDAAERGSPAKVESAFLRFADAFDAHISLEDAFYFPAVRGMHPEVGDELEGLVEEHRGFRRQIESVGERIRSPGEDWREPLERFVGALSEHELREEALLARVAPSPG